MNTIHKMAVAKVVKSKDEKSASTALESGEYTVDFLVRVMGSFRKGEDFEKTMPNTIKWPLLVALLGSKVNQTTLDAVLREYAAASDSGEFDKLAQQTKDKVQHVVDELKGTTKKMVTGPVTSTLVAEIVATTTAERSGD